MSDWQELVSILDSCHSLFLREIGETDENMLRLILNEAKVSSQTESLSVGGTTIQNLHRVETTGESRVLELTWPSYIVYCVTNESFSMPQGGEAFGSGRLLRHYADSSFLAHVARATIATDAYPGPYRHLQIVSENHVVDVISTEMPTLRLINRQ